MLNMLELFIVHLRRSVDGHLSDISETPVVRAIGQRRIYSTVGEPWDSLSIWKHTGTLASGLRNVYTLLPR